MKNDLENEVNEKMIKSYNIATGSNPRPITERPSGLPLSYVASRCERCKAAI